MGHYRFGPLGRMVLVDTPGGGFTEVPTEFGATHVSLNGTATKDVFGYKRAWSIPLIGLAPTARSWFELAYRNAVGPCYFLDEERVNRLSEAASSTLSAWSPVTALTASINQATVTTSPLAVATLSYTAAGVVVQARAPLSSVAWTPTAAGTLIADDFLVPVGPGEHVVFSLYVVSGAFTVELVPYGPTLAPLAAIVGGVDQAENLTRRYLTYAVPGDGSVVAVRPRVRVAGAGLVRSVGWQLEQGDLPTAWVLGAPAAKVLVSIGSTRRRSYGNNIDSTLALMEA